MVLCAVLAPSRLFAQQPSIHYVYDDLNRLVAVVDQEGNAATYTYDTVGNILRIDRFDATGLPGGVAISMFTPSSGTVGTTIQVFGKGFGETTALNNVFFDGRAAAIIAAAPNRLVVRVPIGATTGPITVAAPLGSAISNHAFRVLGELAVAPQTATLRVTGRTAFVATESGAPITSVRWAVNGLPGGDLTMGTISSQGIYMAPAVIPVPPMLTITATHHDDPTLSASAAVTVLPALSVFAASRPVSVAAASPPLTVDRSVGAAVSVWAEPAPVAILGMSPPVSVELEPVILSVDPPGVASGEPTLLTITGRGLTGATSLVFLRDNAVDSNVSVANVSVDADGTQATAEIIVAAGAALGARVVQILTPARASSPAGTGGNIFTVR